MTTNTVVTQLENAGVSENVVGHENPRVMYGLYSGDTSLQVNAEVLSEQAY